MPITTEQRNLAKAIADEAAARKNRQMAVGPLAVGAIVFAVWAWNSVRSAIAPRPALPAAAPAPKPETDIFTPLADPAAKGYPSTGDEALSRLRSNWSEAAAAKWGAPDKSMTGIGLPPFRSADAAPGETLSAFESRGRLIELGLVVEHDKTKDDDGYSPSLLKAFVDAASPGLRSDQLSRAVAFLQQAIVQDTDADVTVPGAEISIEAARTEFDLTARPSGHRLELALEAHNRLAPGDAKPSVHHLVITQ